MSVDIDTYPELALVLLAEDDTEESVLGSDLHYEASSRRVEGWRNI